VTTDPDPDRDAGRRVAPVLIVDDNASKRLSIEAILAPLGHDVVSAASGEEALRAVMTRSFAVILMDVQMPAMDGYETARLIRLRRECEHTPIIFITADSDDGSEVPIAYASGAVDFMVGKIVPGVLRAKVSIFVELYRKSVALECLLEDVTFLSEQFRDSEAHFRAVLHNVADGIVTLSDDGVIESFNRAATRVFGYTEREALGRPFAGMIEPARTAGVAGSATGALGRRSDGTTFPIEQSVSDVQLGTHTVHIVCLRDISEREAYIAALKHQTLHDALTGLPNRLLFRERLSHAVTRSKRTGEPLAVLIVDLDDFKHVNDTIGHQNGDILLRLVAARLVGCLRDSDTVSRLSGDEFAILPLEATELSAAATVAWKVQEVLKEPFAISEHSIQLSASIGMALVPEHGDNIDDLMRRADLAMYDAKRRQSRCALFAAEQEEAPAQRLALLDNLRHCVAREELVLHYQPKIDLASREAIGVEALIRWNHPSGRLLGPDEFMPEIEGNELMVPITKWVINEALRELALLRGEGFDLTMAINLGARCLADGAGVLESVEDLTTRWGVPPDRLTFELTESALIDTSLPELLRRLQAIEQHLSIDDFGTGYSSLVYLQRLPVLEVKADRSFVMTMATVDSDAVIVRSIIDLAHNLSVNVVAEGVEDEATMAMLIEYGCDEAQGYHFARPMPGAELVNWLQTSPFGVARRLREASRASDAPAAPARLRAVS
jgi:diguanylate cyclase (GGDEF)-like protein/PAS domain S-box-containing protein